MGANISATHLTQSNFISLVNQEHPTPPVQEAVTSEAKDPKPAVCPVPHRSSQASEVKGDQPAPASAKVEGVCPVPHAKPKDQLPQEPSSEVKKVHKPGVCPVHSGAGFKGLQTKSEPADSKDHYVPPITPGAADDNLAETPPELEGIGDIVPGVAIPSTGRGNSEDGQAWLNPSANQLHRALERKNKGVDAVGALNMAIVHASVTDATWNAIMEYEKLHADSCPNPVLARFMGMYGKHTVKSRLTQLISNATPFDRHDWIVNRCGTEVRYIIDYYAVEQKVQAPVEHGHGGEVVVEDDTVVVYSVDARPALTPSGIYDRFRLGLQKWKAGESIW